MVSYDISPLESPLAPTALVGVYIVSMCILLPVALRLFAVRTPLIVASDCTVKFPDPFGSNIKFKLDTVVDIVFPVISTLEFTGLLSHKFSKFEFTLTRASLR